MVLIQYVNISPKEKDLEKAAKTMNEFQKGMVSISPIKKRHKLKLEVNTQGICSWDYRDDSIMLIQNANKYSFENGLNKNIFRGLFKINPNSWNITEIRKNDFFGRGIYAELEGDNQGIVRLYSY